MADDGARPKPSRAAPGVRVTNMSRAAGAPAGAIKTGYGLEDYDPDEEIRQALAPDPKGRLVWDFDDERYEYDAELFEMNPISREVQVRRYPNKAALWTRLQEATGRIHELNEGMRKLREAGPAIIGGGGGPTFDAGDIFSTGADFPGFQQFAGTPMGGWLNSEYIPMMTGPFCLTGDTKIPLVYGPVLTLEEMTARGATDFWVYSYDIDRGVVAPGKVEWVGATGEKPCLRITLDNGETITASTDHPFMLHDARYMRADELRVGDRLMPLYRHDRQVFHPEVGLWSWIGDSSPWLRSEGGSWQRHLEQDAFRALELDRMRRYARASHDSRRQGDPMPPWVPDKPAQPLHHPAFQTYPQEANHMIASIEPVGVQQVYDLQVADYHNFAVDAGVFVHNTRQLYMYDYLKMHALVFEAVNHNPIARQAINITTSFVVGKGVTARCKTTRGQEVWDDFDHANRVQEQLRTWSNELALYGEIMLRHMKNPYNGDLKIRPIDPATVWEIVTEPDDLELVYYYWQQYPTPWQMYTVQGVPTTRYIIRQLPADEILHIKVNVVSGEKRGRSDLFSVLGWLKRFKDYTTAEVVRAQAAAAYVWDDTVAGSDADVQRHLAWLAQNPPSSGEAFAHNEAIKRTFLSNTGRGPQLSATGDMLMNVIAVGLGIPKEYLGINTGGARATALVATEPAARKFEMRQYVMEGLLHKVWNLVADAAGLDGEDRIIEFTFPSIATEDRSAKIQDVGRAEANLYLSKRTAAEIVGKELAVTTYSWDDERQQLMDELGVDPEHYIANAFAVVPKIPPAQPAGPPQAPSGAEGRSSAPQGGGKPVSQQPPVPPHQPGVPPGSGSEVGRLARPRQPWKPPQTRLGQNQRAEQSPRTQVGAAGIRRDAAQKESREPTREELIERAAQVERELAAEKARRGGGTQYTLEQSGQPGGKKSASGVGGVIVIGQEDEYDREFNQYGRDDDPRR